MTLAEIAKALYDKTSEGRLEWSMNGAAQVSLKEGHNLIEINEIVPNQTYQFMVRNKDGLPLDQSFFDMTTPVGQIFDRVRRKHLRVDEEFDDLFRRIEKR